MVFISPVTASWQQTQPPLAILGHNSQNKIAIDMLLNMAPAGHTEELAHRTQDRAAGHIYENGCEG